MTKASEILRQKQEPLDVFFAPKSIAVIGATETGGSVGRTIFQNLIATPFGGTVFPINPKRTNVFGIKAYPAIAQIPEPIDLAVIVTPAAAVPRVVDECIASRVKGAIIISAGFKETGKAGEALERDILRKAKAGSLRLIGPNCLGVMRPPTGMNATFADGVAAPGSVAFISQSGALCTAILDWSRRSNVGFSAFISVGSMLDVGWGDLIDYLGDDPQTKSILIYMESIGNARAFLSAAREVALTKPIIVIKAGRTELAAKAAASHTGSLAGSDAVLEAAFRRSGVLRVKRIADLFYMAEVLAKQPRPMGPRLAIVTNAGGPGVLATDALVDEGLELAALSKDTMDTLNLALPPAWSHGNPADILGDAAPERYRMATAAVAKDKSADGLLVVLTPQAMTDPTATAEQVAKVERPAGKPVLASWMGGPGVEAGISILSNAGIPTFPYPDTAVRAFAYMWRYTHNLRSLYETPEQLKDSADMTDRDRVEAKIREALSQKRTLLTEDEAKLILAAYGIPTVKTLSAGIAQEAVRHADALGYPVVLKLLSHTITHKTDVGGVKLNLKSSREVREAFQSIENRVSPKDFIGVTVQPMISMKGQEVIVGSSVDAQFGPVLLFGAGGTLVEVFKDRALALPPLTTALARRLMEETKIYTALKGTRGAKGADMKALENILVRFSQLIAEHPRIKEMEMNPLLVSADGIIALDARVVLHEPSVRDASLPKPAIRPYPRQYTWKGSGPHNKGVTLRPIRPEDEPLVVEYHTTLSEQSVFRRYLKQISLDERIAHQRLIRVCFIDYDREIALVADEKSDKAKHRILAIGRLIKQGRDGEISVLVGDPFQGRGLGGDLTRRLVDIAQAEKLNRVVADILPENLGMQKICQRLGFTLKEDSETKLIRATRTV